MKNSPEQSDKGECVPLDVPSRAWVDEVKTLKQGDIHIGRASKQRNLLPSFWATRYKVSKFGRSKAVELHKAEVNEDPQCGRRIHGLSGKRLLCHCKLHEDCHGRNLQDLFRRRPHAFDPTCSDRPPLSGELNILAKAREEREDSEESGLEDAVANAPQGWLGVGKPMVIGSGYVERRLCDGQGPCSPGTWAPEDRNGKVSHAFSLVQQSPSPQCSSCQNSLWVVMGSRCSVKTLFGG